MKRINLYSFRTQLIIVLLLAVLPVLALTLYTASEVRERERAYIYVHTIHLTKLIAIQKDQLINTTRELLIAIAHFPGLSNNSSSGYNALFSNLREKYYHRYSNIAVAKSNGDVFCSAIPLSSPINIADSKFFKEAVKTRDFTIGDLELSSITHKPSVNFAYPIIDKMNNIKGIVLAELDLDWFNKLEYDVELQLPKYSTLTELDDNGIVLIHFPDPNKYVGKPFPLKSVLATIKNQGKGVVEVIDNDGIPHLYSFRPLESKVVGGNMYVVVGIPTEVAFSEINSIFTRNLILIGLVAFFALAAVRFASDRLILRPLGTLVDVTRRWSNGELGVHSGIPYQRGEIGQLSRTFDEMADTLQEREEARKHAEQKLRQSEANYRLLVENQTDMVVKIDLDSHFLFVSPSSCKVLGKTEEELLGQTFMSLVHEEDREPSSKAMETIYRPPHTACIEQRALTKDGWVWLAWMFTAVVDSQGEVTEIIGVGRNINERKRNEQIQSIIYNISNAVLTCNSLGDFLILVKDELGKLINTKNFFVALYNKETDSISLVRHHDEKDKFEIFPVGNTLTNYVIKTGKPLLAKKALIEKLIESGEVELIGHLPEVWFGMPFKSMDKIIGIFAVQSYDNENAFDEADVKVLEIISNQISLSLERLKVEEDLKIALEKAEEMNKVKSYFFANMSHEIRTPFVAIRGYAELLREELTDPEDRELVERIITGADRLTDTLNKILTLTKLEFDKFEIKLKELNIYEVINYSFKFFSKEAEKKNLNFIKNIFKERNYNEKELIIKFDEEALEEILNNLLSNAIKYTEKGSIELKADIEKRNEDEFLVIKVTDTGIGIPKEKQNLIWEEFRQVSEGVNRSFQGTGLGLAITKKQVELLGGKISVESEEGKGSTFIVELPIRRTGQVEKSTAVKNGNDETYETVETNNLQISKKILYVEDDRDAQNVVYKTLSNNYTIEIANNTDEALAKVKSQKYDAFLIDINLGKNMDGVQLMKMIREMPEYKKTPMMAITAYAADNDREEFLAKGFTHYISKPFALKELKELVREMIG